MDHKNDEELAKEIKKASTQVQVGGKYVHYKSPHSLYEVKELGILEADDSVCVIYRSLTSDKPTFVRPLSEWVETVEWQGNKVQRFKKFSSGRLG